MNIALRLIAIALGLVMYGAASGMLPHGAADAAGSKNVVTLSATDRERIDRIDASLREIAATFKSFCGGALIALGFLARQRGDLRGLLAAIAGPDESAASKKGKT